jgi:hypothetical protein
MDDGPQAAGELTVSVGREAKAGLGEIALERTYSGSSKSCDVRLLSHENNELMIGMTGLQDGKPGGTNQAGRAGQQDSAPGRIEICRNSGRHLLT